MTDEPALSWVASVEREALRLGVRTTDWRRFNPTAISAVMQARPCRNTAAKLAAFVQRQTRTAFLSAYARLTNGV